MKICILADPIDEQYAGVHFYTKNLVKNLLKIDQENEYIIIHCKKNLDIQNRIRDRKAPAREVIIKNYRKIPLLSSFRKFIQLPLLFRSLKPDIILETAHIGPFSFFWKCKEVTIIYDLTPVLFPQYHILPSKIIHKFLFPMVFKRASGIIAISHATKNDVTKIYSPKCSVHICYPGKKEFATHNSNHLKTNNITKPYILSVGTIEPRKNLTTLLHVFQSIKHQHDIQWVIVGKKGWGYKTFIKEVKKSSVQKDIIFLDYVSESQLASLYSKALALVYPSFYEGFGMPILEAMQNGCPVICSNTSSMPEVIDDAGTGCNPHNMDEWELALRKVLSNEKIRQEMREKGYKQAEKFSWERGANQILHFLKNL